LPLLEALESLLHRGSNPSAARVMKQIAPTWYAQIVPLSGGGEESARLLVEVKAASPERMKRELGSFLQEVSRLRPLVLFFDDLHWAGASTIDLLAYLTGRFDTLRVLVVVTYRPSDLLLQKHPFLQLKPDLQARGLCHELSQAARGGERAGLRVRFSRGGESAMSAAVAQSLLDFYGEQPGAVASQLAVLYSIARDFARAVEFYLQAVQRAAQVFAHAEAAALARRGLELLEKLPETPERARQELRLQTRLGASLMVVKGYGAPEVRETHLRMRALGQQLGDDAQLLRAQLGLSIVYIVRAE
jgi:hypothetical protein